MSDWERSLENQDARDDLMSGHTPGPWRVYIDYDDGNPISIDTGLQERGPQSRTICTFPPYIKRDETALANARLIEKAPETAAALERAREDIAELVEKADAALRAIDDLIAESDGVAGLNVNGDLAPWQELNVGGRAESWLMDLEPLRAALAKHTRAETSHGD